MQRISFETAKLAKEKGYRFLEEMASDFYYKADKTISHPLQDNTSSIKLYPTEYFAPYQAELQEWLRERHNIHISLSICFHDWGGSLNYMDGRYIQGLCSTDYNTHWHTYEDALEFGLQAALKLI